MTQIAKVEFQAQSGVWVGFGTCANKPSEIKRMLEAALRSQLWISKARAVDSETGQLIDMALK